MSLYPIRLGGLSDKVMGNTMAGKLIDGAAAAACPALGGVNSSEIGANDPVLVELGELCARQGFRFAAKAPAPYSLKDYVFGAGSVFPHDDGGMGLTAAVFVAAAKLSTGHLEWDTEEECHLLSGGRCMELSVGDAFIFNADVEHAWISNCRWVLACHHVQRIRKK